MAVPRLVLPAPLPPPQAEAHLTFHMRPGPSERVPRAQRDRGNPGGGRSEAGAGISFAPAGRASQRVKPSGPAAGHHHDPTVAVPEQGLLCPQDLHRRGRVLGQVCQAASMRDEAGAHLRGRRRKVTRVAGSGDVSRPREPGHRSAVMGSQQRAQWIDRFSLQHHLCGLAAPGPAPRPVPCSPLRR